MSWWEFRGFWGILQRSRLGLELITDGKQQSPATRIVIQDGACRAAIFAIA